MTRRVRAAAIVAPLVVGLAAPAAAMAHAAGGISYDFPLPLWMYAMGGAVAVLASVPAAIMARPKPDRLSGDVYPRIGPLHLGRIATAVAGVILVLVVMGGLFGSEEFASNPASVVIWVDLWVGLGIVSAFVANVWDFASPLSAAARWLDRTLAARGYGAGDYPERLGMWPAVVLVIAWGWLELCWPDGAKPQILTLWILIYIPVQLFMCAAFSAEVWLPRGELFTAFARVLSKMAPVELYVRRPAGECPALMPHGHDDERRGCPACWLAADPADRGVRLRLPGAGIHREGALPAGGGAFVVALLATVVFDGFRNTSRYLQFSNWIFSEAPAWLSHHSSTARTLHMIIVAGGFALVYYLAAWAIGRFEGRPAAEAAARYAPSLIPIAGVYFAAHYLTYLIVYAQFTPGVLADPFEKEWVPDYGVWTSLPSTAIWWLQVGLIVAGHVVAVFQAHRIALQGSPGGRRLAVAPTARRAATSHAPLTALMIAYTAIGLWVLASAIKA